MEKRNIIEKAKSLYKGQFGVNLIVERLCDKDLSNISPYIGRLRKRTLINNVRLGTSYSNCNTLELKRETKENKKYVSSPLKGMHWEIYPIVKVSDKTLKKYIAFNFRLNDKTTFKNRYFLDNKEITKKEFEAIIQPKRIYCKKQSEFGLIKEENQTKVLNYCVDDILLLNTNKEEAFRVFNK